MKYFVTTLPLILLFFFTQAQQPSFIQDHKAIVESEKLANGWKLRRSTSGVADNYDLKYHRCEWNIDPNVYYISGSVTSYFKPTIDNFTEVDFDFASNMQIDSILYHGGAVSYSRNADDVLDISLPAVIPNGTLDSVSVYYEGSPRQTGFGSFFQDTHDGTPVIWSLSEPYGAEDWWPCKQSLNDKVDSIDILVTCPKDYRDGSNGLLISETENGDYKTYHWKSHYPIAAYLVAIAVTNYATYTDSVPLPDGKTLQVLNYVYPENLAEAQSGTHDLIDVIKLYDTLFETYPFAAEKYGHAQFSWGGGMEHQTMTYVSGFDIGLLDHECAHQWFGDKVTCASWSDVWLNEGWATYCEGLVDEYLFPYKWKSWKYSNIQYITSVPFGSVYCQDTTDIGRLFDDRLTYSKGAYVLHMLRWVVGDSAFFKGVRDYLNDPTLAYGYAHTADLQRNLEASSGKDLTGFFDQWYYGEGFPIYNINYHTNGHEVTVAINQNQSDPSVSFFAMPVPIEFKNGTQDTTVVFNNTFSGETFTANLSFTPQQVIFDPDYWILSQNNTVTAVDDPQNVLSKLMVFPSPARNSITVTCNGLNKQSPDLIIINGKGEYVKTIAKNTVSNRINTWNIDITDLAPGIYFVKMMNEKNPVMQKFVKQ